MKRRLLFSVTLADCKVQTLPRVPLPRQKGGAHRPAPAARPWRKRKHKGKEDE